jgi:hypothetical protein
MINNSNLTTNIRFTSGKYNTIQKNMSGASKCLHKASENSIDAIELGKTEKKFYEIISKPFRQVLNSNWFNKHIQPRINSKEGVQSDDFQKLLIWGNTGKEIIRCLSYVGLTLTNEDIPYDKRLFVSMFHVGVGTVSISLQLILGLGAIKYQDKIIENMLKKLNLEKAIHDRTKTGLKFFIPLALTNIAAKRLIAPAFATPFAGIQKKRLMKSENDKKTAPVKINEKNADYYDKNRKIN